MVPELDSARNTSSPVIMPRSPWLASAGCMKNAGVPVDASVEAILRATCPDLPMPLTTTRPRHSRIRRQACTKARIDAGHQAVTAAASMRRTSTARSTSRCS